MKVSQKLLLDRAGLETYGPVNIVILGDSISHGSMNGYIDYENVYWNVLRKKLNKFRDYMPVNMINSSIGGTTASAARKRLDSQVLAYHPDLVIVCFGLNDVNGALEDYLDALREIFARCAAVTDVIFLTPNMHNTYVSEETEERWLAYAAKTADMQNSGKMDRYIYAAIDLANAMGIPVCDCYSKWKALSRTQDVTKLLINRINHPTPEMHRLFAQSLYEMILGDQTQSAGSDSTMFQE